MFLVTYGALKCFKKHIARLQTTKVAKHPGASPVLTRVGLQILTLNTTIPEFCAAPLAHAFRSSASMKQGARPLVGLY